MGNTNIFNTLYDIDTRDRAVEKNTGKSTLEYLPWAVTYSEVAKRYESLKYGFVTHTKNIKETRRFIDENGNEITEESEYVQELPYNETPTGLEVETWVEIDGISKSMRLPVYDATYHSMRLVPYTYETKTGTKTVPAATMADVYKSIMRCLAKNLSMWGVGLNYWTREDAPESVIKVQKLHDEIDKIYTVKKKKGFTDQELLQIMTDNLPAECGGNWHLCEDEETLTSVKKVLLSTIKANKAKEE